MPRLTARDVLTVHRLEFPFGVNTACQASWGACFAVASVRDLADAATLLAIAANFLILVAGLALNTAVDIPSDRHHPERGRLAGAALRLGRDRGIRLAAGELAVALALAVVISVWTGRWLVAGAAVVAAALHVLYNVEPWRCKRRGFLGAVVFAAAAIGAPCVLSHAAVRSDIGAPVWLIFVGLTVLAVGRVVWWSVPDREADAAAGVPTPSVRHGAGSALAASSVLMPAGLVLLGWGLWLGYGPIAAAVGSAAHLVFVAAALVLLWRVTGGAAVSSTRLRKRAMPLVMAGDLLVVAIALVAG